MDRVDRVDFAINRLTEQTGAAIGRQEQILMRIKNMSWMAMLAAGALAVATVGCDDSGGGSNGGGTDTSGTDTSGTDTSGTDTSGTDTNGTDTGDEDTTGGTDTSDEDTKGDDTGGGDPDVVDTDAVDPDVNDPDVVDPGCPKEDGECTVTYPEVFGKSMRVNAIQIGDGGQPGEALDVDNKGPEDCSPTSNCSNGIDNALSILGGFANGPLEESVTDGSVNILVEVAGEPASGPFVLQMYVGDLAESNAECDNTKAMCDYEVSDSSWGCDCELLVKFDATLDGDQLTAGGPGYVFAFSLPIQDVVLDIAAYNATLVGTLTFDEDGNPTLVDGILGGAVRKSDLAAALDALPEGTLAIDPGPILAGLTGDIDTTDDGIDDALSIGLKLSGSASTLVGVKAE